MITTLWSNYFAYRLIRKIDNKERKRIEKLEIEYLEKIKKLND